MAGGGFGGLIAGWIGDDATLGLSVGCISAGVVSLALSHIFRGSDPTTTNAFLASSFWSGMVAGPIASVFTSGGILGAFLGAGTGAIAAPLCVGLLAGQLSKNNQDT